MNSSVAVFGGRFNNPVSSSEESVVESIWVIPAYKTSE